MSDRVIVMAMQEEMRQRVMKVMKKSIFIKMA